MITHYTNRACNLTYRGSRLCVLGVWLVAYNHFHLHHIDSGFFLACGAKQREFHQHSVLIYPRSCFSAANWAVNPSYFVHLFISTLSPAAWLCIEVSGSSQLFFIRMLEDVRVFTASQGAARHPPSHRSHRKPLRCPPRCGWPAGRSCPAP